MSNEKDTALLQLQLQQGRASLQAAATLGANLQSMAGGGGGRPGAAASMPSATVQPHHATAQDRHVFRNMTKPGYNPQGPQPGAFSQPVQVQEAEVTAIPPPPPRQAAVPVEEARTNLADIERNEEQHNRNENRCLGSLEKQDYYCVILIVALLVITLTIVGVTLGVKFSNNENQIIYVEPDKPTTKDTTPTTEFSNSPSVSAQPTATPSAVPSSAPSVSPAPSKAPSIAPSFQPSISGAPSGNPTSSPSSTPSISSAPSSSPSESAAPSGIPSQSPTRDLTALRETILSLLPQQTVQTIQNDPRSPQGIALTFAALDTAENPDFPNWRILQRYALAAFHYSTGGKHWRVKTFWLDHSESECDWFSAQGGLACHPDVQTKTIKRLTLWDNNLRGTLPPELFLFLPHLQKLGFSRNGLTGSLPSEIGLLTHLEELSANANQLTGQLPTQIGLLTNLIQPTIRHNLLTGSLPSELGKLYQLESLSLIQNELQDTIPTELGRCQMLDGLFLFDNQLSGPIPSQLGTLHRLETLSLPQNQLQSSIPSELGLLRNMGFLRLYDNQLSGTVPIELVGLRSIKFVDIRKNAALEGQVPSALCKTIGFDCNDSLCGCDCACDLPGNATN